MAVLKYSIYTVYTVKFRYASCQEQPHNLADFGLRYPCLSGQWRADLWPGRPFGSQVAHKSTAQDTAITGVGTSSEGTGLRHSFSGTGYHSTQYNIVLYSLKHSNLHVCTYCNKMCRMWLCSSETWGPGDKEGHQAGSRRATCLRDQATKLQLCCLRGLGQDAIFQIPYCLTETYMHIHIWYPTRDPYSRV